MALLKPSRPFVYPGRLYGSSGMSAVALFADCLELIWAAPRKPDSIAARHVDAGKSIRPYPDSSRCQKSSLRDTPSCMEQVVDRFHIISRQNGNWFTKILLPGTDGLSGLLDLEPVTG